MSSTKLLKFRPLANEKDFERVKEIVGTGKFWCSKLWNLNDPMEGVYRNRFFDKINISEMFDQKNNHIICSFSSKDAINEPLLWGYYANGFKGVAIEIDANERSDVFEIKYTSEKDFSVDLFEVKDILTRKLECWQHEKEYRFLKQNKQEDMYKAGKISKVYFGNPYSKINNKKNVDDNSHTLRRYNFLKRELELFCKEKKIPTENYELRIKGD
jgi:hypothetical protein